MMHMIDASTHLVCHLEPLNNSLSLGERTGVRALFGRLRHSGRVSSIHDENVQRFHLSFSVIRYS